MTRRLTVPIKLRVSPAMYTWLAEFARMRDWTIPQAIRYAITVGREKKRQ